VREAPRAHGGSPIQQENRGDAKGAVLTSDQGDTPETPQVAQAVSEPSVPNRQKAGDEISEADNSGLTAEGGNAPGFPRGETAERLRAFVRGERVDLQVAMLVPPAAELHKQARCLVELLVAGHVPMALLKAKALEQVLAKAAAGGVGGVQVDSDSQARDQSS
jgi:NADPH:quinone reductase-like Zn-dependent oxidoreductase